VTVVRQRLESDCGVTSLAILMTDIAMRRVDPEMRGLAALYNRELVAAARIFGIRLRPTRRFDLDHEQGLLRIRWNAKKERQKFPDGHFVTVLRSSVHCPLHHEVLPWREYMVKRNATPVTLLREIA